MSRITLVTRAGCHLCEQARQTVHRVATECGTTVTELDIDADNDLPAKYAELVPVVLVDGREVDYWVVDEARLRRALASGRGAHRTARWLRGLRGR